VLRSGSDDTVEIDFDDRIYMNFIVLPFAANFQLLKFLTTRGRKENDTANPAWSMQVLA